MHQHFAGELPAVGVCLAFGDWCWISGPYEHPLSGSVGPRAATTTIQPLSVAKSVLDLHRWGHQVVAKAVTGGDAPTVVARAIITAAAARTPRLRSTAAPFARRISLLLS